MRLPLSFAPLPLVQLVEQRSHQHMGEIQCWFSSLTVANYEALWIPHSGDGCGSGREKYLSRLSGVTEMMWIS